jgi:PAS domain S-box-containing protein
MVKLSLPTLQAGSCPQSEDLLGDYVADPSAPRPEEVRRLVSELTAWHAELESQVTQAIEHCREFAEQNPLEGRIARLNHLKEQLLGPCDLGEKLKLITQAVVDVLDADFARIWVIEEGDLCEMGCPHAAVTEGPDVCRDRSRCLHLKASSGRYTHTDGGHRRVPLGCYKIGRVALGAEPKFITNDVTHDPRVHDRAWAASLGLASFAGYRLLSPQGTPLGVLALFAKRPMDASDDALLEDLAHTTSQVIRAGMAEELVRREKALADIVIASIPGLFYVLDRQGRFVRCNQIMEEVTGWTAETLRGTDALLTIFEDDRELVASRMDEVFEKGQAEVEARFLSKDGVREFWFTGRRMDVRRTSYLVGSGIDITERKQAEEQSRQAQERLLEHQRCEKELVDAELSKARDTLVRQTRLAAVGQVSAGIAHELRNPLAAVQMAAALLKRNLQAESPKCREYVQAIESELAIAREIIDNLMAMSRGKPPVKKPVDLGAVVTAARRRVAAPEGIAWEYSCQPAPLVVHADPGLLEQVFRNLFANSVQAMGRAGKTTVRGVRSEAGDDIVIADTGPGIPAEVRDRLFEPLVTTKPGGTGLGLPICRQIIEQHGGTMQLIETGSSGTAFLVRLPLP